MSQLSGRQSMKKTFDYLYESVSRDSICVDDVGNLNIEANNDLGHAWFLSIKTLLGYTYIFQYGPYALDIPVLPIQSTTASISKIQYDEKKICKIIENFLIDPKRDITQTRIIDDLENEDLSKIHNLFDDYIKIT